MNLAVERIALWRDQPPVMVQELFGVTPDVWQHDALMAFRHSKPRLCMKACAGPGKTAVLAWIGWNFMLTRPHPKVGAASIDGPNLKANLWSELARWYGESDLLQSQFEVQSKQIIHREHPLTWKIEARSWSRSSDPTQAGNAFRGLHAEFVMWLLDETGEYPDSILPICENIFSGEPKEARIVQAGNPLMLSGPLYRACTTARANWHVIEITADPDDPKRTPRVSVEHARQQIREYGADNAWILVNIFGRFPPSSINALIGPDKVRAAMARYYREHEIGDVPKILGVDVARFGDDQSIIAPRHGIQIFPLKKYRNLNSTQGAGQVSRFWTDWGADACFIDMSGGWGTGWFDQLQNLRKSPIGIQFGGNAHQRDRYYNKRSEMAFEFVQWIKNGGALPDDDNLLVALTQSTYTLKGDTLLLEPKELVKKRLNGRSPDELDACMLTFAEPVTERAGVHRPSIPVMPAPQYQPFTELDRRGEENRADRAYRPFAE